MLNVGFFKDTFWQRKNQIKYVECGVFFNRFFDKEKMNKKMLNVAFLKRFFDKENINKNKSKWKLKFSCIIVF